MEIALLLCWLLVGLDVTGDGTWTPADSVTVSSDLKQTMDGPLRPPPPNP
jgi:hypothetical protein